ncbi:hypothetical protein, partial [Xanthomonas vesicatoria]
AMGGNGEQLIQRIYLLRFDAESKRITYRSALRVSVCAATPSLIGSCNLPGVGSVASRIGLKVRGPLYLRQCLRYLLGQ